MGKSRLFIIIMTVLLVCALLFMGNLEDEYPFVTVRVPVGEGTETVKPWYDYYTGNVYFFIPGSVALEDVTLHIGDKGEYSFGGISAEDGMACGDFRWNEPYEIEGPVYDGERLIFVAGSEIPVMFLDVDSGSMDYLHENKERSEHGQLRLYDAFGESLCQGELNTVKGRGQSSWLEEKKSYNISLRTAADLLGMGSAENWVLQANSKDPSSVRNKMVFDFAQAAGLPYAPDSTWVDLYLNGEYAGLYLLCERIEVHPERVDIPEEGSFLVTKDGYWRIQEANDPYVRTQTNTTLEIKYADLDAQMIQRMFQSVENAVLDPDGIDPVSGKHWTELIDVDSWVNKYLIEEVFSNTDGQTLSQYYYLDGSREDDRISAGPVWDYDLAVMGPLNAYQMSRPEIPDSCWMPALFNKEAFYTRVQQNYTDVFKPLLEETLTSVLNGYAGYIRGSHNSDALRWGYWENERLDNEIHKIREYLQKRSALFDRIWTRGEEHIRVTLVDAQGNVSVLIQEPGSLLPELGIREGYNWYADSSDIPAEMSSPVYADVTLRQRRSAPDAPDPAWIPSEEAEETEEEEFPVRRYLPLALLVAAVVSVSVADGILRKGPGRNVEKQKTGSRR